MGEKPQGSITERLSVLRARQRRGVAAPGHNDRPSAARSGHARGPRRRGNPHRPEERKMTTNLKVTLGMGVVTALIVALIVGAVAMFGPEPANAPASASGTDTVPERFLVREDSHRLST